MRIFEKYPDEVLDKINSGTAKYAYLGCNINWIDYDKYIWKGLMSK